MTATQFDEARAEIPTLVQNYPVNTQDFMYEVLLERAMITSRTRDHGWAYRSYHDLLVELAEPRVAPIDTDDLLGVMEERHCYSNCYEAVLEHPDEYTYVEGLALAKYAVVRHAWLERRDGKIIDPTWVNLGHGPGFLATYLGVRFAADFVLTHTIKTGRHSFFDADWMNDYQIIKRGLLINDAGLAYSLGGQR